MGGESLGYHRYVLCRTILCRMVDFVGKLGHECVNLLIMWGSIVFDRHKTC